MVILVFLFQFHYNFISKNSLLCLMLMVSYNIAILKTKAMENPTNNTIPYERPKHPECGLFTTRLDSYLHHEWPIGLGQTPNSIAEAELFYIELSDKVQCYHCGGGLCRSEQEDNPWIEHSRNYPIVYI